MHVRGFPNAFFGPAQSGFTATYTYSLDEQSAHLAHIMEGLKQRGAQRIEASEVRSKSGCEQLLKARLTADFQKNARRVITTMKGR